MALLHVNNIYNFQDIERLIIFSQPLFPISFMDAYLILKIIDLPLGLYCLPFALL